MGPVQYLGRYPGWIRRGHFPVSPDDDMGRILQFVRFAMVPDIIHPAIGGLLAGIIIMKWAPETAGSGTDHIIDSVHHNGGKVRTRIVPVKIIASALTIGSGGSLLWERRAYIPDLRRDRFVHWYPAAPQPVRYEDIGDHGDGGGMVGGLPGTASESAIFTIEVPYKNDLESNAAIPSIISSVTSYLVFIPFGGAGPVFFSTLPDVTIPAELLVIVLALGAVIGMVGIAFVLLMRRATSISERPRSRCRPRPSPRGLLVG